jgi:hypothetical protein
MRDFQCRVRIINGLVGPWRFRAKWGPGRVKKTRQASFLAAAVSSAAQKKAGARPAFSQFWELR